MHFKLAWRNIWRNPRRTAIILTAIVIGVWSMIFLGSFMRGMEVGMIQNGISTLTGNLQIHQKNYRSDPVIENSMTDLVGLKKVLSEALPHDAKWAMRIRVNAIASNARHSTGVTMVGIDAEKEAEVSFIGKSVTQGRYFHSDDTYKIVVGQAFLDKFEAKIGHKLILMTQDTRQEIASKAFRIVGVFRTEMQATEKQYVFIPLSTAQKMLKIKNGVSEVSIVLSEQQHEIQNENDVSAGLKEVLAEDEYAVETWKELLPMLNAYLKLSDGFIYIWYLVVFIAMGFGIVNTTLMAIFERMREFGLLKALGMKPRWIIRGVLTESFFLLVLGIIIGNILGFLTVFALSGKGIDLSAFASGAEMWGMTRVIYPFISKSDLFVANLMVFFLGLVVSAYPALKAARFTPVEALGKT